MRRKSKTSPSRISKDYVACAKCTGYWRAKAPQTNSPFSHIHDRAMWYIEASEVLGMCIYGIYPSICIPAMRVEYTYKTDQRYSYGALGDRSQPTPTLTRGYL